jgi:hypothetical protein
MTPAALAQARADQATATREKAERALARVMRRIDKAFDPVVFPVAEAISFRRWESIMEMPNPPAAFAQAYSAFRRAQRLEARARNAAHVAKFDAVPAAPAPPRRKTPQRMTIAAYLAEARAA